MPGHDGFHTEAERFLGERKGTTLSVRQNFNKIAP